MGNQCCNSRSLPQSEFDKLFSKKIGVSGDKIRQINIKNTSRPLRSGVTDKQRNFLGAKWKRENDFKYPTPHQVYQGVLMEADEQTKCNPSLSEDIEIDKMMIIQLWEEYSAKANITEKDTEIDRTIFDEPSNLFLLFILQICSMNSFVMPVLNMASQQGDESKVATLGPFALVLEEILLLAPQNRKDINISRFKAPGVILYKGDSLTQNQIQEYRDAAENEELISLFGFNNTSFHRKEAESNAVENKSIGDKNSKFAVVFKIKWASATGYYQMTMSPFFEKSEVLLSDGEAFQVVKVDDYTSKGNKITLITLATI